MVTFLIWFVTINLWLIAGAIYGTRVLNRWRREEHMKQLEPVCGCKHHVAFHLDKGKGKCMYSSGAYHKCNCQQYVGPTAIELE